MTQPTRVLIDRLLGGISRSHVQGVRNAWRDLLGEGTVAVPAVLDRLDSAAWQRKPVGPSSRYLGILLALLLELDEVAFKREIQRLKKEPLHSMHRHTVDVMSKRKGDRVYGTVSEGVPVYIADDVDQSEMVYRYLQRWSCTPDLAISSVARIDVIALTEEMDYLGRYLRNIDGIVLTWQNGNLSYLRRWRRKFQTELTFYHAVGHHFHQHSVGGQVKEQEKEADDYKRLMYRKAHPVFVPVARVLFAPLFWTMKIRNRLIRMRDATEA